MTLKNEEIEEIRQRFKAGQVTICKEFSTRWARSGEC